MHAGRAQQFWLVFFSTEDKLHIKTHIYTDGYDGGDYDYSYDGGDYDYGYGGEYSDGASNNGGYDYNSYDDNGYSEDYDEYPDDYEVYDDYPDSNSRGVFTQLNLMFNVLTLLI